MGRERICSRDSQPTHGKWPWPCVCYGRGTVDHNARARFTPGPAPNKVRVNPHPDTQGRGRSPTKSQSNVACSRLLQQRLYPNAQSVPSNAVKSELWDKTYLLLAGRFRQRAKRAEGGHAPAANTEGRKQNAMFLAERTAKRLDQIVRERETTTTGKIQTRNKKKNTAKKKAWRNSNPTLHPSFAPCSWWTRSEAVG